MLEITGLLNKKVYDIKTMPKNEKSMVCVVNIYKTKGNEVL